VAAACLDEGDDPVRERRQPRVVGSAFGDVADVEVQPAQRLVLELRLLDRHEGRHLVRHLGREQDPAVAFHLDQPLAEPELVHPIEVGDGLRWQGQAVTGSQLGDPLAVLLAFGDLAAQPAVDVLDPRRELLVTCGQQLSHA
jgi:hypothetical protein